MSGARSLMALAVVVGLAVLREGSKVVLFLYGVIISSGESGLSLLLGGVLGLLLGAGISALAYGSLAVIPSRHFKVTSVLLAFMAAQSVAFLEQATSQPRSEVSSGTRLLGWR